MTTTVMNPTSLRRALACGLLAVCFNALAAPVLLGVISNPLDPHRWWKPGSGEPLPALSEYEDRTGTVATLLTTGELQTKGHPFFEPLGSNGRACVSCHQPADGMSLSVDSAKAQWQVSQGKDPLFAAADGSNCPNLPQADPASHSLLLEHGLLRVPRAWPPKPFQGQPVTAQFSIEVVRDPTGCNLDPRYGLEGDARQISVYRRPRAAANLKYVLAAGFSFEPKTGLPLPRDPLTGEMISGNLMADARFSGLREQALDAHAVHLGARVDLSDDEVARIQSFLLSVFSAQSADKVGGSLTAAGAKGGPWTLAEAEAGVLNQRAKNPMWAEYAAWFDMPSEQGRQDDPQRAFRESVARGIDIFRNRTFLVSDSAGINSNNFGNPTRDTCAFCHNATRVGNDIAPGQVDLGTTTEPYANNAPHLPLFKLTCKADYAPHPFLGRVVYTSDPGYALTTGRCIDIGKVTIQPMRGLAARPPYFVNGSAKSLLEIVEFYDRRYNIGYSEQDKQDLVNFLGTL